jgi:hypothetical protein
MTKRVLILATAVVVAVIVPSRAAHAWSVSGYVYCDANGNSQGDAGIDTALAGVAVTVLGNGFSSTVITDAGGFYSSDLPDFPATYQLSVASPNGALVLVPTGYPVLLSTTDLQHQSTVHFLLGIAACSPPPPPPPPANKCWMTGGGAKYSAITNSLLAIKGPQHSFGGNVNPGCNADAGDGGNWNHIAHALKLHFQGKVIEIIRCGNVDGIPPGSTSPVTPCNFIEFRGTGTLKGIQGNKADYGEVTFFARVEDRNEPGSNGQRDGSGIDRYFLQVLDSTLTTRLLIDLDGDPSTIDPVTITDGNLQLHISSCDNPPTF